jgi:hypothetical protein
MAVKISWVLAADLGQSADPTAVCVLEKRQITGDKPSLSLDVRHLERLALGMAYPAQVAHVKSLLSRPPLDEGCQLAIDDTGVGRAVGDLFEHAGLKPIRVQITAGSAVEWQSSTRVHVAKTELISALDARLHTGELRFALGLKDADALRGELGDFQRHVSDAGRASYQARAGKHDDLVLAVSLAVWHATQPPRGEVLHGYGAGFAKIHWHDPREKPTRITAVKITEAELERKGLRK